MEVIEIVRLILENNNLVKTTKLNLISVLGMIGNSVCMMEDALPVLKVRIVNLIFFLEAKALKF